MRVDRFIKGDPGDHSFIAERRSIPSKRDKGRKQARLLHAVQDAVFDLGRRVLGSTVLCHAEPVHHERNPLIVEDGLRD